MNCTVPKGDQETCAYSCAAGYGVNGSAYTGEITCNLGTFVWDQPTACTLLPTTIAPPVTTAAPTEAATTAAPTLTTKEGETVVEIFVIVTSLKIKQDYPEGTTGESLFADTGYVSSVETGIAKGLGGDFTTDDVTIVSFVLSAHSAARRLQGIARRLPEMELEVNYEIEVADAAAADSVKAGLADPATREAFTNSFVEAYTAAEEAAGRPVTGLVVTQSAETTVKTEQRVVPAPAPPATPAPTPAPTNAPAPTPAPTDAPTPAAPAAAAAEEEEDGSAGMIGGVVGGIAGAGVLGGAAYMYNKRKQQASE